MAKKTKVDFTEQSMTHYNGKVVAYEVVEFSHNAKMTISKIENKDGTYQMSVGFFSEDAGHSTCSTVHFPMNEEVLEVAEAFTRIAEHFPE